MCHTHTERERESFRPPTPSPPLYSSPNLLASEEISRGASTRHATCNDARPRLTVLTSLTFLHAVAAHSLDTTKPIGPVGRNRYRSAFLASHRRTCLRSVRCVTLCDRPTPKSKMRHGRTAVACNMRRRQSSIFPKCQVPMPCPTPPVDSRWHCVLREVACKARCHHAKALVVELRQTLQKLEREDAAVIRALP